jgi:hypothetical protein
LVIDPYREACSTRTRISRWSGIGPKPAAIPALDLQHPFLFTGFDEAPATVREALAHSLAATGCAYIGRRPLPQLGSADGEDTAIPWLQLLAGKDQPDPRAHAIVHVLGEAFEAVCCERQFAGQLIGMTTTAALLPQTIPYALDRQMDLLLLDGSKGIENLAAEKAGHPELTVIRDALSLLRKLNKEEEIALLYFGGMRTGTDVAKILAFNCLGAVFGTAMGFALGGSGSGPHMQYDANLDRVQLQNAGTNWIRATAQETAIIARCTGKTDVHNLEPEDTRCISLVTAESLGLPLASGQSRRERF